MSININNQKTIGSLVTDQHKAQKDKSITSDSMKEPKVGEDSVQLTSQALGLDKIKQQSNTGTRVNIEHVQALKNAILNGDYKINAERLASKITQFESNLGKEFKS